MTRPRVKICGIREPADGVAAVEAGADYIGVVFAERVRRVTPAEAASVVSAIRARGAAVGVFVDAPPDEVLAVRDAVGFDVAQLHGDEPPAWCERLRADGLSVWKAIRPRAAEELARGALDEPGSRGQRRESDQLAARPEREQRRLSRPGKSPG